MATTEQTCALPQSRGAECSRLVHQSAGALLYQGRFEARDVAIKIWSGTLSQKQTHPNRLRSELKALGDLSAHALGRLRWPVAEWQESNQTWSVYPWIAGQTVKELEQPNPKTFSYWIDFVLCVALETAKTLQALHSLGWTLGDVSPSNLLVDAFGQIHLIDLGSIEPLDGEGTFRFGGTPRYAHPLALDTTRYQEPQVRQANDLYALVLMSLDLMLGRSPFGDSNDGPLGEHYRGSWLTAMNQKKLTGLPHPSSYLVRGLDPSVGRVFDAALESTSLTLTVEPLIAALEQYFASHPNFELSQQSVELKASGDRAIFLAECVHGLSAEPGDGRGQALEDLWRRVKVQTCLKECERAEKLGDWNQSLSAVRRGLFFSEADGELKSRLEELIAQGPHASKLADSEGKTKPRRWIAYAMATLLVLGSAVLGSTVLGSAAVIWAAIGRDQSEAVPAADTFATPSSGLSQIADRLPNAETLSGTRSPPRSAARRRFVWTRVGSREQRRVFFRAIDDLIERGRLRDAYLMMDNVPTAVANSGEFYGRRATILDRAGLRPELEQVLLQWTDIEPSRVDTWIDLSLITHDSALRQRAFGRAADLAPRNPRVLRLSCSRAVHQGQSDAVAVCERASRVSPSVWFTWADLSAAHERSGNQALAVAALDRAIDLFPDPDLIRRRQQLTSGP